MVKKIGILLAFVSINIQGIMAQTAEKSLHDFKVEDIYGETFDFRELKGKKVLIVNTASECGLTPQYETLEEVYEEYGGDDFVIVGFPANSFGAQEPGTNEDIVSFCKENYGVSFPMMAKISVKGEDMHPLYQWLTKKENNGVEDAEVSWNFQKFMINEEGKYVGMIKPQESPASEVILNWIQK